MTYQTVLKLITNGRRKAYRKDGNRLANNDFIFYEGCLLMKTTGDWPIMFVPTDEDERAEWETAPMEQYVSLPEAITVLQKALDGDRAYFNGWKSNIAMAFYDEVLKLETHMTDSNRVLTLKVANDAAEAFLNSFLIKPTPGK